MAAIFWGTESGTNANCTSSSTDYCWSNWNSTSDTYTISSDTSWYRWNDGGTNARGNTGSGTLISEEDRIEAEKKAERLRRKKEAAERKARELLFDLIGEKEFRVYKETGRVYVKGKKHDYIVQKTGYVQMIEKDKIVDLCIHLQDKYSMPETDNVIALKLFAEADEEAFLKTANRHASRDRPTELPLAACM